MPTRILPVGSRIDKDGQIVQGQWAHRQAFDPACIDLDLARRRIDQAATGGDEAEARRHLARYGHPGGPRVQQQLHRLVVDGTLQTIVTTGIGLEQQLPAGGHARFGAGVEVKGQQTQQ